MTRYRLSRRRLASQLSLKDLDQAFEAQAVRDTVSRVWDLSTRGDPTLKDLASQAPPDPLNHVFMAEREAAMCHVMADVAGRHNGKELVAVVGENHVPGECHVCTLAAGKVTP